MDVTAQSLQGHMQKLQIIQNNTYNVLLKNALTFIHVQSSLGAQECFHTVPLVLPGHALFPYEPAVLFITTQLQQRGFHVTRHNPHVLHITWFTSGGSSGIADHAGSSGTTAAAAAKNPKKKLPKKYTAFLKKKV